MINEKNEFEFDKLKNKPFDVIVRFYKQEGINYVGLFSGKVDYAIQTELKNHKNRVIKRNTIEPGNFMPKGFTNEYFEWTLMRFDANQWEKYKVKIIFDSGFNDFDTMKKEIYLEQHYDRPSAVWWFALRPFFLIIFIITFIPILIMGLISWRRKKEK